MPLRVGLCGLGGAGLRAHLPGLRTLEQRGAVVLAGVCDPSPAQRHQAASIAPGATAYSALDGMLADADLDLLAVATPPSVHLGAIAAALEHGVHIVCEKPLGLSTAEVHALHRLAADHPDQVIATVHQYRHAKGWQITSRLLAQAVRREVPFRLSIEVERPGTDPLSAGGWRSQPVIEGGILGDHAVHYLSLIHGLGVRPRIIELNRTGGGGAETALIRLALGAGEVTILVTYAGRRRRNSIELEVGDQARLAWNDGRLAFRRRGRPERHRRVGSLSDRNFVNALYTPFYRGALASIRDPERRRTQTADTLAVAVLLEQCMALAPTPIPESVGPDFLREAIDFVDEQLQALSRVVLLAFADLGIYLPSNRERLVRKIRAIDPLDPTRLEEFIDLCIEAELITPETAGRLRLSPFEAKRLAQSLDGHTPVPEDQATDWAQHLGGAPA